MKRPEEAAAAKMAGARVAGDREATSDGLKPIGSAPSTSGQQRQTFSLKQLAASSRKKRSSVQEQCKVVGGSSGSRFARLFDNNRNLDSNWSSSSSAENSCGSEQSDAQQVNRRASDSNAGRLNEEAADESDGLEGSGDESSFNDDVDDDSGADDDSDAASERSSSARGPRRANSRRNRARRPSGCNCEPLINKLDADGLQVTDVDLVSYKDLCQMEQQHRARQTNLSHRRHLEARGSSAAFASAHSSALISHLRRSSLQEESGAYYQLCTSGDEQLIRQKYVWYPPSLKQLALVDQFFASFAKDKIPYQLIEQQASKEPQHPASGSYRDEQISFQLPRQDISLDYCSYAISEQSRLAYLQFVDKRNSQALNVGTALQLGCSHSSKPSAGPFQSGEQAKLLQSQQEQQVGAQRCRRCLVRLEDKQLAVMAPSFIIGSALYPSKIHCQPDPSTAPSTDLSAPINAALFHPNCFTCAACKEFLVDLVYCLRDNKLYCLRHYGESLRPRCNWCQEVSIRAERWRSGV